MPPRSISRSCITPRARTTTPPRSRRRSCAASRSTTCRATAGTTLATTCSSTSTGRCSKAATAASTGPSSVRTQKASTPARSASPYRRLHLRAAAGRREGGARANSCLAARPRARRSAVHVPVALRREPALPERRAGLPARDLGAPRHRLYGLPGQLAVRAAAADREGRCCARRPEDLRTRRRARR